ncbi:uncharacterized protein EV420DRAFT_235611 [Desarmillaria tabescens]|uniref:Uncharacterized protein n=1 Tax=Armillaria tabescens TaxID=1929756 RepID=A0AA39J5U2_ARMTA|nr:uncharacterized protein EV420DRAFT_235611 [Desarmillaria tabescens]KAK0436671.1 hypothetical protein EV420DRAFT_235611 [Desarmillaria tabescens]
MATTSSPSVEHPPLLRATVFTVFQVDFLLWPLSQPNIPPPLPTTFEPHACFLMDVEKRSRRLFACTWRYGTTEREGNFPTTTGHDGEFRGEVRVCGGVRDPHRRWHPPLHRRVLRRHPSASITQPPRRCAQGGTGPRSERGASNDDMKGSWFVTRLGCAFAVWDDQTGTPSSSNYHVQRCSGDERGCAWQSWMMYGGYYDWNSCM